MVQQQSYTQNKTAKKNFINMLLNHELNLQIPRKKREPATRIKVKLHTKIRIFYFSM